MRNFMSFSAHRFNYRRDRSLIYAIGLIQITREREIVTYILSTLLYFSASEVNGAVFRNTSNLGSIRLLFAVKSDVTKRRYNYL